MIEASREAASSAQIVEVEDVAEEAILDQRSAEEQAIEALEEELSSLQTQLSQAKGLERGPSGKGKAKEHSEAKTSGGERFNGKLQARAGEKSAALAAPPTPTTQPATSPKHSTPDMLHAPAMFAPAFVLSLGSACTGPTERSGDDFRVRAFSFSLGCPLVALFHPSKVNVRSKGRRTLVPPTHHPAGSIPDQVVPEA